MSRTPSLHEGVFIENITGEIQTYAQQGGTLDEAFDGLLIAMVGMISRPEHIDKALEAVVAAAEINGFDLNVHIETDYSTENVH